MEHAGYQKCSQPRSSVIKPSLGIQCSASQPQRNKQGTYLAARHRLMQGHGDVSLRRGDEVYLDIVCVTPRAPGGEGGVVNQ